jgi:hypothetical protein
MLLSSGETRYMPNMARLGCVFFLVVLFAAIENSARSGAASLVAVDPPVASLRLDVCLANDAAVFVTLFANKRAEIRAAHTDRKQPLGDKFFPDFWHLSEVDLLYRSRGRQDPSRRANVGATIYGFATVRRFFAPIQSLTWTSAVGEVSTSKQSLDGQGDTQEPTILTVARNEHQTDRQALAPRQG